MIESCILNSKLLPYAEKLGYNLVFSEDGVAGIKRVTLKGINTNYLKKQINRLKSKNVLIFIKPLTLDSLKYAIVNKGVNAIVLDDDNVRIFKKTMLNLIRIN
ncbi:MAG: RNase P subunit p30, partial [Saccharolobus sp.]